ncbi:MAG: sugar-binding protein [Candidatus Margulisbacteria bacterium]|nr:sugar-binding protein [Candidatus Margulisiibacteriota bacterium]
MKSKLLAVSCLLLVCMSVAWSMSHATGDTVITERKVFLGVFREGAPKNMALIKQFETQAGKKPAMIMWYQDWAQEFPKEEAQNVAGYGAVPHIVWEPWYWSDHNKVKLQDIIDGKWDGYIRSWAKSVKEFGQPVFLRVGHEFNMEGYPWGIVNNDKDPDIYIKAYRRIVDIFRKEGADNARWIWAPMNYSFPDESWNDWVKAYPGDNYVDWIGFDGYNWGTTQSWSDWQALKYLFRDQMRKAHKLWPNKPIMIAEFASTEQGGDKAAWIKELPSYLKTSMRDIDLIVWFDVKKETDWRINSSERSLAAFKAIMKDPLFSSFGEELAQVTVPAGRGIKKTAIATKASGPVKIDGKLDEWSNCVPLVMKDISFFKEGLVWGGLADLSGDICLMWDDANLYLAAKVADKIPLVNKKKNQDIWNGDAIEMVISLDPGADQRRDSFDRTDYQVGFGTGDGRTNKPTIWNWQRRRVPTGSEIVVKKTDKPLGYTMEAKIPWAFFGAFVPTTGAKIGFDIALDDADLAGEREKQFIWNGDYYFYKDPSVWGIVEFK